MQFYGANPQDTEDYKAKDELAIDLVVAMSILRENLDKKT